MVLIPSVDYLTMVIAGYVLYDLSGDQNAPLWVRVALAGAGAFLFIVGALRAVMGALGL